MPLTLLIPDLLAPRDAPAALRALRLATMERWLARADVERLPAGSGSAWLARAWKLAPPPAFAAISLAGDVEPREGSWLRADPVHLRIERDLVALHDAAGLGVTQDEAWALVASLNTHFKDDGLKFTAPVPERWYVRVPEGEAPSTTPLDAVAGRDIFGSLPVVKGRFNWRSALTEAQMVMSNHAVNQARDARGAPALNSVWLWGEGRLPPPPVPPFDRIVANEALARGLATISGVACEALPASPRNLDGPRNTLAVLDTLTRPIRSGDVEAWCEAGRRLEQDWFAAIDGDFARFAPLTLVLPGENATLVATVTKAARWRWLKRPRPLVDHA
ncbi:hypothetical protein BWI17_14185 [Betaproteobacteria bacterium GR16-43]|nr:hypothetical protein BWI17_14185 [Betaproteobacteria bacterium GR16-43]